ncbi:T9SS type A sorting domain-containing protein [Mesonia aestuariivivens]|uniref:T9SS type A sorting domain-containing protein n=1 Tax=Mesonia aestuariivivens TaxID=2796128 RepID=A0ABS6W4M6_9FLAO|nr:T9SS type A sorting domain-containing protein [Mesonia aestuariivivens]MBW2962039.1 T9SS type A sorting domain-containing protein [Mesonia aestuariivivens]
MKTIIMVMFFLFITFIGKGQPSNVEEKFILPETLNESSGAIFFNDKLVTHNDSGNENKLYEVDTLSGLITRTITITNATHVDWEDLTQDENFIYVGDIGNNSGNRTDLKIYKIAKSDYVTTNSLIAEVINFNYSDQFDFSSNPNQTQWDAEALISLDENQLILLTKNWVNGITSAYPISKNAGTHSVSPLPTTLSAEGLITGAAYNSLTEKIYAIGYTNNLQPFVWECESFLLNDIFSGTNTKTSLTNLELEQVEAITHIGANRYFVTSESFNFPPFSSEAKLFSFTTNDPELSIIESTKNIAKLYPNPVKDVFFIENLDFTSVEIYDTNLTRVLQSDERNVNISKLATGIYWLKIKLKNDDVIQKIIKY